MCGIAGYIKTKNSNFKITGNNIINTLKMLEVRGKDATGVAWQDENKKKFWVIKTPSPASDFIELEAFKSSLPDIIKSKIVLLHTRQATQGDPVDNQNNHPIHNRGGLIIHNGMVHVSETLPGNGETDTEQIMLYIQKYGFADGLNKVSGSMSIAYIDFKDINLYLYSEIMPLSYHKEREILIFASTSLILSKGFNTNPVKDLPKMTLFKIDNLLNMQTICSIKREVKNYEYNQSFDDYNFEDLDQLWESYKDYYRSNER